MNAQDEQITQVILTFAQPVLVGLPNGCSKAQFAGVMRTVLTVWNAVVKDAQDGGNQHETAVLSTIASAPKEVQLMVKRLIKRKKTKFATDQRQIGQHWVHEQGGEVLFGCEAADEQPAASGVPFKTK